MGFTLEKVVPWGRSYGEYVSMFDLTEVNLGLRILGCGDGPAEGALSPHLPFVKENLENSGFCVEVKRVPYEFQRGGNEMMVIKPV